MPQARVLTVASAALAVVACGRARIEEQPRKVPRPALADTGELCADVGVLRACWGAAIEGPSCVSGVCLVERPLPERPSASGWRCDGQGPSRVCSARAESAAPFECSAEQGARCTQTHPRLPDDGLWDCAEIDGVVRCTGGQPAAGVVAGPPDPGWLCGPRRGTPGERVCVDFAPDVPEPGSVKAAGARRWSCGYDRNGELVRFCVAAPKPRQLGGACAQASECPAGSVCAGARCLPRRPAPDCYQDGDCGAGAACRFGTCAPKAG